jgi:hypothetical protein
MANTAVRDLKPGDMVDLQNDPYADPRGDHIEYEFELAVVAELTYEGSGCIVVEFNESTVGFPPDHQVRVEN